jgi:hypothetical protein
MSTNGSSTNMEKNKNTMKGPPPPVAPKPSWPRQTSTVKTATVVPPITSHLSYSQSNDENKIIHDISHSNITATERHPSQKFNRSSSMNQISTNIAQQQDIIPTRNKSLSIPDSRLIYLTKQKKEIFIFCVLDFQKVFILNYFVLLVS